jgi:RimJ/RimL family protein N-acetyltransferase
MYFGKRVHLRPIEPEDLDNIMKHWNNLEMRQYLAHAIPMSRAAERDFLDTLSKADPWKDGRMVLAIENRKSQEYLGSISLGNISKQNRNAELGIAILDPNNFGKGYGTDSIKVMLWVGFNILGLESIYLSTFPQNERGQRAFKSAGFKQAGVLRRGIFTMGEFRDLIIMDVLKEEFFERYPPGVTIEDAK